jgi:hypothetical protein
MPEMEDSRPARPSLVLRLGITGARNLHSSQLFRIRSQLKDVIGLVKADMERLASLKEVAESYDAGPTEKLHPSINLVTPLALGADRLAAREALEQGCRIQVPMPFPQAVYEEDFTGTSDAPGMTTLSAEDDLAEFHHLLSRASGQLELDGEKVAGADDDRSIGRAYEAVGRFVVRHCDLLIAVWDGKHSNGRGGTAEIVHYAATVGVPVWWINAEDEIEPMWLADIQDIHRAASPVPEVSTEMKLRTYLERLMSPPPSVPRHKRGWQDHLASWLGSEAEVSPLQAYFREQPCPRHFYWKTYSAMMNWAARSVEDPKPPVVPPENPAARFWFDRYAVADGRANDYADRYRSSYLLSIVLTTLALVFGAASLGLGLLPGFRVNFWSRAMPPFELASLLAIVTLVVTSLHLDWHRKSIEYRLVAELFRKQETLAALGWALSIGNVQRIADTDRLSWVAWLFAATQRCAPLLEGRTDRRASGQTTLLNLIDEQLAYHRGREKKALRASLTFEKLGGWAFVAVLISVTVKFFLEIFTGNRSAAVMRHSSVLVLVFGLMATLLPGISAAFVAIRSYAELELLAEQSHHMILELQFARARVSRMDVSQALISQDLGAQAHAVATLMLHDLDGWERLFRGKPMEAL